MPSLFYPPSLRQLFTNRQKELDFLQQVADDLVAERRRFVAIFGLRRIGKTMLMLEQLSRLLSSNEIVPVYINCEDICSSPEIFSQRYVGMIVFWALTRGAVHAVTAERSEVVHEVTTERSEQGEMDEFLTTARLLRSTAMSVPAVSQTAASFASEFAQSKPDTALIVKQAFDFPQRLARDLNKKIILFIDEFPEITVLSHYPQIDDPLKLFRASLIAQPDVAVVCAGSAVHAMEAMFTENSSPLFLQFEMLSLAPFTREQTLQLANKLLDNPSSPAARQIHRLSFGHPFYVTAIVQRMRRMVTTTTVDANTVKQAFILETLSSDGQIYNYCRYLYDVSLHKARGYGILKAILQLLSEEENLPLSEIARRIQKSPAATRGYLRWLQEVDLVSEEAKLYFYIDPVLRYWVAHVTKGIEIGIMPRREELLGLLKELEEKYQSLSSELGVAKESEIRELISRFNGQEVPGDLFHNKDITNLPAFQQVIPYRSADGQLEVDALAENDERWVIEIKWRGKMVGVKEMQRLLAAAQTLLGRPWFISKAGFTPDAIDFARREGILWSHQQEMEQLAKIIGD